MNKFSSILKAIMSEVHADNAPTESDKESAFVNSAVDTEKEIVQETQSADETTANTAEDSIDIGGYKLQKLTATLAEIERWHAHGSYTQLQQVLLKYDLSHYTPYKGYDKFKIGYDSTRKCATIAVDATHYVTIPFENGSPKDNKYAAAVLNYFKTLMQNNTRA